MDHSSRVISLIGSLESAHSAPVHDLVDALDLDVDDPDVVHAISRLVWRVWFMGANWGATEISASALEMGLMTRPMQLNFGPGIDTDDPLGPCSPE